MAKKDLKKVVKSKDSGESVLYDLKDDVQAYIDDGYDLDDAITAAIDGVYQTKDIIDLGLLYGVIDDSQILRDCYEDLYNDLASESYDFPKWAFLVAGNDETYQSGYDYDSESEADDAGYDFVEEVRDSIDVIEEDGEFVAYVTFDGEQVEVARGEGKDDVYTEADAWVDELEYTTEME